MSLGARRSLLVSAGIAVAAGLVVRDARSHETLTTTVLFDREIVRVLDGHCVMCHMADGPAVPLTTYEETWLKGRRIRADVIARHMPPWSAVPGYGEFANDNSLTLRETQFVVSWVEGLGPRNAGRVFLNVQDAAGARPREVRAEAHVGHWQLGEPDLAREVVASVAAGGEPAHTRVVRAVVDPGFTTPRQVRAIEYMPGNRRVVRAAFFTVERTGQWLGSWTPWHGVTRLPDAVVHRLPAGSRIIVELHVGATGEAATERGTLGMHFADGAPRGAVVPDLVLTARPAVSRGAALPPASARGVRLRAAAALDADTDAIALWPELPSGLRSIEVTARTPDGGTRVLLFATDLRLDWPTPYIFREPVRLRRGTTLSVTAYGSSPRPVRVTLSRYRINS